MMNLKPLKKFYLIVSLSAAAGLIFTGCGYRPSDDSASSASADSGNEDTSGTKTASDISVYEQEVTAKDDFTGFSALSKNNDGSLHLPLTVCADSLESNVISAEHLTFTIPGCWQDNIVIRSRYIDNTDMTAVANTYGFQSSTEIIEFYEKNTFTNHEAQITSGQSSTGLLAVLYIASDADYDFSELVDACNAVRYASINSDNKAYAVFLSVPEAYSESDAAYGGTFDGLLNGTDYMGCIISSSKAVDGENLSYANGDIETRYVDSFDQSGAGIPSGSAVQAPVGDSDKSADSCPSDVQAPQDSGDYDWPSFTNPYPYTDGTVVVPTPTPTPAPTIWPFPTLFPTSAPTATPTPTVTPDTSKSDSSGTTSAANTPNGNIPAEVTYGH